MPYTLEEFKKDARADLLSELTLEERLEGVPSEELLKYIPPEALLKHVAPEERLKGLTIQEIQAYLEKLLKESSSEPKNTGE
ncbi:MAG: hypothetical protein HY774_12655 [Acidobacteria bacterium]|nr:hypothetical protein [Acidobacteriota bacterium]